MINLTISAFQGIGLLLCMAGSIMLAFHRTEWFRKTGEDLKGRSANYAAIFLIVGFFCQIIAFMINLFH